MLLGPDVIVSICQQEWIFASLTSYAVNAKKLDEFEIDSDIEISGEPKLLSRNRYMAKLNWRVGS